MKLALAIRRLAGAVLFAGAATAPAASRPAGSMRVYEDRARGELVIESAPVDVAGASHAQVLPTQAAAPVGGWLHGYTVELVDARGRSVPARLLHHVIVMVPDRRGLFNPIMLRLVAAGRETPAVRLPSLVGYRLRRGDPLRIAAMLHNEGAAAFSGVRVRVRMPLKGEGAWVHPLAIVPFSMDVMPTGTQRAWDLPPGRSRRSWEGRPAVRARILGIGGHLHRYGVALRLEDVTAGTVLWDGRPVRRPDGEVVSMPTHTFLRAVPVSPGHLYRLTAVYDNPTGRTIPGGGMGAAGGAVIPADPAHWPGVDARNREFQLDLRANSTDPAAHARGMSGMAGMGARHR
ncbi:MAG TPA: hypothetical protein VFJ16_20740 [Longimicrobium sp.]|nr:hypothetical protein [Longimicrobium sp.]